MAYERTVKQLHVGRYPSYGTRMAGTFRTQQSRHGFVDVEAVSSKGPAEYRLLGNNVWHQYAINYDRRKIQNLDDEILKWYVDTEFPKHMPQDALKGAAEVVGMDLEKISKKTFDKTESKADVPEEHWKVLPGGMEPEEAEGRTQKVDLKVMIAGKINYFEVTEKTVYERDHHGISNTPIMSKEEAESLSDEDIIEKVRDYFNKQIEEKYNPDIRILNRLAAKKHKKPQKDLTDKEMRGIGNVDQVQKLLHIKTGGERISKSVVSMILHALGNIGPYTAGVANTMKVKDGTYVAAPLEILDEPPRSRFLFKHPIDDPYVVHGPSFIIGLLRDQKILGPRQFALTHRKQVAAHLTAIAGNNSDKVVIGEATELALGNLANKAGAEFASTVSIIADVAQGKVIDKFIKKMAKGDKITKSAVESELRTYEKRSVPPKSLITKLKARYFAKMAVATAMGGAALGAGVLTMDRGFGLQQIGVGKSWNPFWDDKYSFWATPYMGVSKRGD